MNGVTLPVELDSVRDLQDRSCKMTFITGELANDEFAKLRDLRGLTGWLLFGLDQFQEEDLPKEKSEIQTKTPSQRLRACLFVLFQQEGGKGDFEIFYRTKMESLIQMVKNKLH